MFLLIRGSFRVFSVSTSDSKQEESSEQKKCGRGVAQVEAERRTEGTASECVEGTPRKIGKQAEK